MSVPPGRELTLPMLRLARRQGQDPGAAGRGHAARHAVIVLRDEDKPAARLALHAPLVFSVHEAKGLE